MRKEAFVTGEIYHVYNRGVDKRCLFLDQDDYSRFLEALYLFNDQAYKHKTNPIERIVKLSSAEVDFIFRDELVEVLSFCLIDNHFHLLVRQLVDNGISIFLHKLQMGYTKVFNKKYNRSGTLYEGTFKAVHVGSVSYFKHLPIYIHLNALDLTDFSWREGLVDNWLEAIEWLDRYPWSSHGAYRNNDQYLPIIKNETISGLYRDEDDYLNHLQSWSQREFIPDVT